MALACVVTGTKWEGSVCNGGLCVGDQTLQVLCEGRAFNSGNADSIRAMDDFLPNHEFAAHYDIRVNAPPSVVYECLLRSDFNQHWLVRLLMTLRTGKRPSRNSIPRDLRQRLQGSGFVVLKEIPNEELVLGVAGKFWHPDGGRCLELMPHQFAGFSREGYAKAAWNFKLGAESPQGSVLGTETRIQCFGPAALWKFRAYWTVVGPFSGLIRKAILQQVKAGAESIARSRARRG
jgi:hypothetical protein